MQRSNGSSRSQSRKTRLGVASLALAAAAVVLLGESRLANATVVINAPFSGTTGDLLTRGFYVQNYPANNLGTVELAYDSFTAGAYSATLTARIGSYTGTIIGTPQTSNFTLAGNTSTETLVTYNFGGAPVPAGSLITFTQTQPTGPDSAFFDVGTGTAGIIETEATTAPLDTFRRTGVGVVITSVPEPTAIASLIGPGALLVRRSKKPARV